MMLSLMATVRPANGPSPFSWISVVTYHTPRGVSASVRARDHFRSVHGIGAVRVYISWMAIHEMSSPVANGAKDETSGSAPAKPVLLADSGEIGLFGRTDRHGDLLAS